MSLCECGCGGEAKPGRRFINNHHLRLNPPIKKGTKLSEETKRKGKETRKRNKEIKEGKRLPPVLPFCKCGCGQRVTKIGNIYLRGHYGRGKPSPNKGNEPWNKGETKETNDTLMKLSEKVSKTLLRRYANGEIKVWCEGETIETDDRVKKRGERCSKTKKEKFANGELEIWSKGLTKDNDERLKKCGEKISKTKKEFFATEEGQIWIDNNFRGGDHPRHEKMKGDKNPARRPEVREKISKKLIENLKNGVYGIKPTAPEFRYQEFCQKDNLPFKYTGDGQFWIGGKHRKVNPDFIESNGRRIAVEILGDYWHSPLLNKHVKDDDLKNREKHYRRYKWKVIFIWESDIMRPEGEQFVLSLLTKEGIL